jgi:hypothetical protein
VHKLYYLQISNSKIYHCFINLFLNYLYELNIYFIFLPSFLSLFFCLFGSFLRQSLYRFSFPETSLGRPGWPQTHKDLPVSVFQVLGLKACVTTAHHLHPFLYDCCSVLFIEQSLVV